MFWHSTHVTPFACRLQPFWQLENHHMLTDFNGCWLIDDCWNSFAYALGLNAANPFSISTVITYLCQLLLNDFYSNLFSKKCRPYSNEKKINLTGIYLSNKKVRSRQFFLKFLWQARSASLWQHFSTFKLCVLEWFNLLLCKKLGVLLVTSYHS